MLILTRRVGEYVNIGEDITVTVLALSARTIRLGFDAPKEVTILREEVPAEGNKKDRRVS
jgi:carbon storage regulator